jgi:uncharacterized membrane protein
MLKIAKFYNKHNNIINGGIIGSYVGIAVSNGLSIGDWDYWKWFIIVTMFNCLLIYIFEKLESYLVKRERLKKFTLKGFRKKKC